jgi:hypothetical protein
MTDMRKALEEARNALNAAGTPVAMFGDIRRTCLLHDALASIDAALAAPGGEAVAPGEAKGTAETTSPEFDAAISRAIERTAIVDADRIWNEAVEAAARALEALPKPNAVAAAIARSLRRPAATRQATGGER